MEIIGWFGALLLATCGMPQLIKTLRTKDFSGLSLLFILWWLIGELFTLIYVLVRAAEYPLIFNYIINIVVCVIILIIYIRYKKSST